MPYFLPEHIFLFYRAKYTCGNETQVNPNFPPYALWPSFNRKGQLTLGQVWEVLIQKYVSLHQSLSKKVNFSTIKYCPHLPNHTQNSQTWNAMSKLPGFFFIYLFFMSTDFFVLSIKKVYYSIINFVVG